MLKKYVSIYLDLLILLKNIRSLKKYYYHCSIHILKNTICIDFILVIILLFFFFKTKLVPWISRFFLFFFISLLLLHFFFNFCIIFAFFFLQIWLKKVITYEIICILHNYVIFNFPINILNLKCINWKNLLNQVRKVELFIALNWTSIFPKWTYEWTELNLNLTQVPPVSFTFFFFICITQF